MVYGTAHCCVPCRKCINMKQLAGVAVVGLVSLLCCPSFSWRLLSIFLPLRLSFLGDGEQEPFRCEILRALRCSSIFQGKANIVNSCSGSWPTGVVYLYLQSSARHPWCTLLAKRQKMVYFVLLSTYHYRGVVGQPQAGDPTHWAVLRHKAALFALIRAIQCSEAAIPVVLWAALWWDRCAGGHAVF